MILGQDGSDYIADTDAHTGSWNAIQILTDTVFAVLTDVSRDDNSNDITAETFKAGVLLFGVFDAITLTSGSVLAYVAV